MKFLRWEGTQDFQRAGVCDHFTDEDTERPEGLNDLPGFPNKSREPYLSPGGYSLYQVV